MKFKDLSDLFDVKIIAERTQVVGRMVIFPFLALFFLILSRIDLFDNWDWPWSLIGIFAGLSLLAIASAIRLRRSAEQARSKALDRLNEKLCRSLAHPQQNPTSAPQFRLLIEEVRGMSGGAFSPMSQNPVIAALLLPFGGMGVVTILNMLVKGGF